MNLHAIFAILVKYVFRTKDQLYQFVFKIIQLAYIYLVTFAIFAIFADISGPLLASSFPKSCYIRYSTCDIFNECLASRKYPCYFCDFCDISAISWSLKASSFPKS